MNKNLYCIILLYIIGSSWLKAQVNEDDEYTSAFVYGINFNTNGGTIGGMNMKFSQIMRPRMYRTLGIEAVAIKHPQEKRITTTGTSTFIFAKQNYLYSIRPTYGIDYLLFRKAPEESVQVLANFAIGPSLGIEVPYYIRWQRSGSQFETVQAYDPVQNPWNEIIGTGGIFAGIGKAKIIPALFIKAGISLEFGEFRNNITGIEVGFTSELFSRTPKILAPEAIVPPGSSFAGYLTKNKQYMLGAYFTIFLGSRR